MSVNKPKSSRRRVRWLLLVANLVPLTGIFVFEWQVYQALFVYWVEIGFTLLLYFAVVLFAQRKSDPDKKRGGSYPGPIPFPRRSGSIEPVSWLPPIRYQNLQYIPAAFVLVAFVWFFSSRVFLEYPNFDVTLESRAHLDEYVVYFTSAYSLEGLLLAILLFSAQFVFVSRDFLYHRLVDRYSAAMLMEIPCRIAMFWFVILVLLSPVYLLAAASETNTAVASGLIAVIAVISKLAVEYALVEIRYQDNRGWFVRRFSPNERKPEHQFETVADNGPR